MSDRDEYETLLHVQFCIDICPGVCFLIPFLGISVVPFLVEGGEFQGGYH